MTTPDNDFRVGGADVAEAGEGELGQFGHHPDLLIDAEVEVGRLQGLLAEAHGGLLRALDFRTASPEGLAIKYDVRDALRRTGRPEGTWGATTATAKRRLQEVDRAAPKVPEETP